jgi:D-hexose-6-phosphate mutarotase
MSQVILFLIESGTIIINSWRYREEVRVSGWTDRVYLGSGNSGQGVEVRGVVGGTLSLASSNLPDTVLWNPWQEKVIDVCLF